VVVVAARRGVALSRARASSPGATYPSSQRGDVNSAIATVMQKKISARPA
jgi:hypothetical protein